MDKLELLKELSIMVHTGEIQTVEDAADAEEMLSEIRQIVMKALKTEVFDNITDKNTVFYAPEYVSWKDFLNHCNGNEDYAAALESYTEEELAALWEASHIAGRMDEQQIKNGIFHQFATWKMYQILLKKKYILPDHTLQEREIAAKVKGFYNILYE